MHADVCDKDSSMSASFYICFFPRDHPLWLDLCWLPQTMSGRLTRHLSNLTVDYMVPVPRSLVTDGGCFSNWLYIFQPYSFLCPFPSFSGWQLKFSSSQWWSPLLCDSPVTHFIHSDLFCIFTVISALTVPAGLVLPATWQDLHHQVTKACLRNQPNQGTGFHLSVPVSWQFVLPGFLPKNY